MLGKILGFLAPPELLEIIATPALCCSPSDAKPGESLPSCDVRTESRQSPCKMMMCRIKKVLADLRTSCWIITCSIFPGVLKASKFEVSMSESNKATARGGLASPQVRSHCPGLLAGLCSMGLGAQDPTHLLPGQDLLHARRWELLSALGQRELAWVQATNPRARRDRSGQNH